MKPAFFHAARRCSAVALMLLCACSAPARTPESVADSAASVIDSNGAPQAVGQVDSTALPVVITLRRDSLGVDPAATTESLNRAIEAVVPELQAVMDFEVLAISPAILTLNVRPRAPFGPDDLVSALRGNRLVASVEVSRVRRVQ